MAGKRFWNRWIGGLVALGMLGMAQAASADVRVGTLPFSSAPFKTITVTSSVIVGVESVADAVPNVGLGTLLFGFSVQAGGANTECGLYDVPLITTANIKKANLIDEGGVASQFTTFQSNWPAPYKMQNAFLLVHVTGTITTSACMIYVAQ